MPDVNTILRSARRQLEAERDRVDRQLVAVRTAVGALDGAPARRHRSPMSAALRVQLSKRMKAYWAKRRAEAVRKAQPKKSAASASKSTK